MRMFEYALAYPRYPKARQCYLFTTSHALDTGGDVLLDNAAKTLSGKFPKLPEVFGKVINDTPDENLHMFIQHNGTFGSFKTRDLYTDALSLYVLDKSIQELDKLAIEYNRWDFHLEFPENGLKPEDTEKVLNMLRRLPTNVFVYRKQS